jgi:streptogramin lyase
MLTRRGAIGAIAFAALSAADRVVHKPKVELLWKAPEPHPNALQATDDGLWVADQVTDAAYLLDWTTGKLKRKVDTESSNTSGIAYGGGFLWMGANGPAKDVPGWRPHRPTDAKTGEVLKVDAETGKTIARYPIPGGGGVHGITWAENSLWVATLALRKLTQVDVNFKILHSIPVTLDRTHGFVLDRGSVWSLFSNDWVMQKLSADDGRVQEEIQLAKWSDPDPHGLALYKGKFYYSDAGVLPGGTPSPSKYGGYIARFQL